MRRKTKEEFIKEMNKISPDIVVVGDYVNGHTRIKCKCLKCGNLWEALPSNLLRGTRCPACYGTPQKRLRGL